MEAVQRFVRAFTYENVPWREAQEAGMLWAPLRKPHENALDPHWLARQQLYGRRDIPSWGAPSATPRANGWAPPPPGRSVAGRRS